MNKKLIGLLIVLLIGTALGQAPAHINPLVMGWNPPTSTSSDYSNYQTYVLPNIDGVVIPMLWSSVNTGLGTSNFTQFDAAIAPYVAADKKIGIVVLPVSGSPNQATPNWVLSSVPSVNCSGYKSFPVVTDTAFQTNLTSFVSTLIGHYNSSSFLNQISYIRFDIGYLPCSLQLYSYVNPKNGGALNTAFMGYVSAIDNAIAAATPQFPTEVSVYGTYQRNVDNTWADNEALLASTTSNSVGLASENLTSIDLLSNTNGTPCADDWCNLVLTYPNVAFSLKTPGPSSPLGMGIGSLASIIPFAKNYPLTSVEIDRADLEVAYVPTNTFYTQFGQSYRNALSNSVALPPLIVTLVATPTVGTTPLTVNFTATCIPSCTGITWDFGDGTSNPIPGGVQSHTYTLPGGTTSSVVYSPVVIGMYASGNQTESTLASALITVNPVVVMMTGPDNRYCGIGNIWIGSLTDDIATLPQNCLNTSIANTPSPGSIVNVPNTVLSGPNNSLEVAYSSALCGQTLVVPHGLTFVTVGSQFALAPKNCDNSHWITIKSDGVLPPEGTRIDPSYVPQMFTITTHTGFIGIGDHIRFIGMEVKPDPAGPSATDFFELSGLSYIVFDRVYLHGNPGQEIRRAMLLDGSNYIGVVESYLSDFKCIAKTGSCTDAHAIGGGNGNIPMKAWAIKNNYLEASGENIIFGGSAATQTPCDIELRGNTLRKQPYWNPLDPTYGGILYIVKNHFELKNACRLLFEGNLLQNNWGGFSQVGYSLVLGPKNQAGANNANLCPICAVTNITIRYNVIQSASGGMSIFTAQSDNGGWATEANRFSIHDLVIDNLQYSTCYACGHNTNEISSGYLSTNPPPNTDILHDVHISHVTELVPSFIAQGKTESAAFELDGPPVTNTTGTPRAFNIAITNSIFSVGTYGTYPTGGGMTNNCSVLKGTTKPIDEFAACFIGTSPITGNVFIGYPLSTSNWPAGNLFPATGAAVQFTNYNNAFNGDYHLSLSSPYKGTATDHTDPGANVDLVNFYVYGTPLP